MHGISEYRGITGNSINVTFNPLMGTGSYSATSNTMKLVHWPLMGGLLHLVQRKGNWARAQPTQAVPNVTAQPSTANVPITVQWSIAVVFTARCDA